MENRRKLAPFAALALGAAASGCTLTPRPETPGMVSEIEAQESFDQSRSTASGSPETAAWWRDIGGGELDQLVSVLRGDSIVLREARLQADQAREGARIARGQRLPSITAFAETSANRTPSPSGEFSWSRTYTAGAFLDFQTDILGGLRASERAARLNALASEFSFQAVEQREIATLARNWISAATLLRRLDLAERTAESFRSTYDLTNQRYEAGSVSASASDVLIARQNLELALVDIPQIEADLTRQLLLKDEQLARMPGETGSSFVGEFVPVEHLDAPVGSPAALLANRPDVAIAELRYLAALEDVGAARARLYPAMSLGASLTFQADTPGGLFDWDRHIASLANSLTAPLFQGGRLRSQVRLEEARAEELANAFARTALAAMIDVELALAELAGLYEQKARLDAALATARLSDEIAQGRYRQGLISILAVLETQRSLNAAEQNIILTDQAIANARVDLFLSLGGDWGGDWTGETPAPEPAENSAP